MGLFAKIFPVSKPLPRPPVPEGKTRICVSGFGFSNHTGRARTIAAAIAEAYPDEYETWYYFDTRGFRPDFLAGIKTEIKESSSVGETDASASKSASDPGSVLGDHNTSPFCWLEKSGASGGTKEMTAIGGRDKLCDWVQEKFNAVDAKNETFLPLCKGEPPISIKVVFFDKKTPGTAGTAL